ncbi:cupredoxin family copper-binding protein [Pseudomonas sp. N3-W]|jgi:plastocyanin|uniref:Cupredoxin family copper-binding protein n=1 Tax=Pseudomonas fungipugnans TaxID=3024217 RepID=A0ABT6QVR1_9PSED|nr:MULTISPECIES: cupredoxin family copper-binding protein [unclassified Pseudomonas]MDI2594898.1 cupredoxin family copper-binding protein [Pseudomonas sp. 681]UWF51244.1 cupredoxin family copper-binding protein [Pseudomonas sp. N3-W]
MNRLLMMTGCLMLSVPVWAQDVNVDIKEFMFGPKDLTVAVGTKVTWVNDDQIPHTVSETHKVFRSGALDTHDSFSYVFNTPGEYEYFCVLHPQMIGRIVVTQ